MWGLWLLTFGLPWVAMPGIENPYLEPKALWLTAIGWGLVLWRLFRLPSATLGWRNPWTVWLAGWVVGTSLWKFQWLFLHRAPGQSRIVYNEYVWFACGSVLLAFLLVEALSEAYLRSDGAAQRLTQWMVCSAMLAAGYGVCQSLGWDQWYATNGVGNSTTLVWAGFGNPGYLALYLAMLLPLCLLFSSKRYLLYAALMLLTIFLTQARYAWGVAVVGVGSSLLARWWKRLPWWGQMGAALSSSSLVVALAYVGYPILIADETRLPLWSKALALLHPTYGIGAKNALSMTGYGLNALPILLGSSVQWAHNEWVQLVVEIGVIGTGLTALMVGWSVRDGWRAATRSLLASGWFGVWMAFLAASLVHFPGHLPPLAFVGLCAWAILARQPEGA